MSTPKRRPSFLHGVGTSKPLAPLKTDEELKQLLTTFEPSENPHAKRGIPHNPHTSVRRRRAVRELKPINDNSKTNESIHKLSPLPQILDDKTIEEEQLKERLTQLFDKVSEIKAKIDGYSKKFDDILMEKRQYYEKIVHDTDDYREKEFYSKKERNAEFKKIKNDKDVLEEDIISDHDKINLLKEQFKTLLNNIREFKTKFSLDKIDEDFKNKISSFQPELKGVESELRSLTIKNQNLILTLGGKRRTKNNRKKRSTKRKSSKNSRRK